MAEHVMQAYGIGHPAPHRERSKNGALFTALLAAPTAWIVQLCVNYGLAAQACFPRWHMRPALPAHWAWLPAGLIAINLIALAIVALGIFMSWRIWRRTDEEGEGGHSHLINAGEGRTRFLAVWGIWSGVWFFIMTGFNTVALFGVPTCAG
jgi:small-conductance mechanosensitive channel